MTRLRVGRALTGRTKLALICFAAVLLVACVEVGMTWGTRIGTADALSAARGDYTNGVASARVQLGADASARQSFTTVQNAAKAYSVSAHGVLTAADGVVPPAQAGAFTVDLRNLDSALSFSAGDPIQLAQKKAPSTVQSYVVATVELRAQLAAAATQTTRLIAATAELSDKIRLADSDLAMMTARAPSAP